MIVLDTNVVSEMMKRGKADRAVTAWLDHQIGETIWLTSVTIFEIRFGIELLTRGQRRSRLEEEFARAIKEDFEERVLAFDRSAAETAAGFVARRRAAGKPVEFRDAEIAGIVAAQGGTLATRNGKDFEDFAITLVNPWMNG